MKTTLNAEELKELNACEDGFDKFCTAHGNKTVTLSQALESNGWHDVWWFISEAYSKFSDDQKHDLRIFGCEKALVNIEKIRPYCSAADYTDIVSYLINPTERARRAVELKSWSAMRAATRSKAWLAAQTAEFVWSAAKAVPRAVTRLDALKQNEADLMELFKRWESEINEQHD